MKRLAIILLALVAGFVLFALVGYWMILLSTSNTHDGSLEAIMTAVFALGPLGAIIGAAAGTWFSRTKAQAAKVR